MADIETQDVALENNGGTETEVTTEVPQKSRRELELELELERTKADVSKFKRIATRNKNALEREETEKPENTQSPDSALSQKLERIALKSAGITHQDDIELARKTAKKWGMDIDEVLDDEDFKTKLERQQTERSNAQAVSGIQGGQQTSNAKADPAYWIGKGTAPTAQDVPDRKTRAKIARALMDATKNTKKFYNE